MKKRGKLLNSFLIVKQPSSLKVKLAKVLLFALLAQIVLPILPVPINFLFNHSKAAQTIELRIARGDSGFLLSKDALTFEWNRVTGASQYVISWLDLTGARSVMVDSAESSMGTYTKQIDMLSPDIVYDFTLEAFDSVGNLLASGTKKVLTQITFDSRRIDESASNLPPDGKEVGINPQLVLKWKIPQVITGVGTTENYKFEDSASPSFRINVGTDKRAENKAALYVNYDEIDGDYFVTRGTADGAIVTDEIFYDTPGEFDGYIGFIVSNTNNVDITPGTIFYMTIEPIFDAAENIQYKISPISGGYTYTPLHFQITKDNYNNIIITIFKVNQSSKASADIASFMYEVQSDTGKDFYNYIIEARESDVYTPDEDTIVIFLGGKNINTSFFYRVAAYSSVANEGLTSPYIEYVLLEETNRAPMPEQVRIVDVQPVTGAVSGITTKSAKLKLRWNKPSNYNALKNEGKTYYHMLIGSAQNDMKTDDGLGYKKEIINTSPDPANPNYEAFDIKYREMMRVNIAHSLIKQTVDGSSLEYEIDGFELFKLFDVDPITGMDLDASDLDNADGYPNWLMPNKVYYIKMYSTREVDTIDTSDSCVPLSFTTPLDVSKNPPTPGGFVVFDNDINPLTGKNFIQLEWDKVPINLNDYTSDQDASYKLYYDVYMSDSLSESSFILAGSSEKAGDILFMGHDSPGINTITVDISDFTPGTEAYNRFGDTLRPNFTYYFKVKCRLAISGETTDRESDYSSIVVTTTKRTSIEEPDDKEKRPLALTDFRVASDGQGNQLVDTNSAMLTWTQLEPDVTYTLIRTSRNIAVDTNIEDIKLDPNYEYFEYTLPAQPEGTRFTFDAATSSYRYFVDDIFPNKIYYFSIQAKRTINKDTADEQLLKSMWTSVTVTTSILEMPTNLEAVVDGQIGIKWLADNAFEPENFKLSISTHKTSGFKELDAHQFSIVEEQTQIDGTSRFYVRVEDLDNNESYYLKLVGSTINSQGQSINYPETTFGPKHTRDAFYELEAKWKGKLNTSFELAVRKETELDYSVLLDSDFEIYSELDATTVGTSSMRYYARIKSIKGEMLSSDSRYYIKVRAFAIDEDSGFIYYSKYTVPVSTRTEFRQKDYDDEQEDIKEETEYFERIDEIRYSPEWKVINSSSSYEIILRGAIVNSLIRQGSDGAYTVELARPDYSKTKHRGVYVPLETIKTLNDVGKNLVVSAENAKFVLRPGVIDAEDIEEIRYYDEASGTDRVYLFIGIDTTTTGEKYIPKGLNLVSDIYSVEMIAMRLDETEKQLEERIDSQLTNLANSYISMLKDAEREDKASAKDLRQLIDDIAERVESSLANYCRRLMDEGSSSVVESTKSIKNLSKPLQYRFKYTDQNGFNVAYSYNSSKKQWNSINSEQFRATREVVFQSIALLECAVLNKGLDIIGLENNHWARKDILSLMTKINIGDIYTTTGNIDFDENAQAGEIIGLIEKVVNRKPSEYKNLDVKSMLESIGVNGAININTPNSFITRQQLASLLVRVYSIRSGISEKSFIPSRALAVADEKDIDDIHFKAVMLAIDIGLMDMDWEGKFLPNKTVSRAEAFVMINRLIDIFE